MISRDDDTWTTTTTTEYDTTCTVIYTTRYYEDNEYPIDTRKPNWFVPRSVPLRTMYKKQFGVCNIRRQLPYKIRVNE